MFLKYKKTFIIGLIFVSAFIFSSNVSKVSATDSAKNKFVAGYEGAGDKMGYSDIKKGGIDETVGYIIQVILSFLGVIFLLLMIYGGFLWMTDRGNESQATKAKAIIINSIIGLIIVISAYAITSLISNSTLISNLTTTTE